MAGRGVRGGGTEGGVMSGSPHQVSLGKAEQQRNKVSSAGP